MDISSSWGWLIAGIAGLAAGWGAVRGVLHWVSTAVVGQLQDDDSAYMRRALQFFLWFRCRRVPLGARAIETRSAPLKSGQWDQVIFEAIPEHPTLFLVGWVPVVVMLRKENHDNAIQLMYLRGTLDPVEFFKRVHREYREHSMAQRFEIIRVGGSSPSDDYPSLATRRGRGSPSSDAMFRTQLYQPPLSHEVSELGISTSACNLSDLSLSPTIQSAVAEAREWAGARQWYRSRGIPWRRGWLLYGRPGSGKSTLVKALAAELNLPVYQYDLAVMNNSEFASEWNDMLANTPCVALIEDIDAVFNGRDNLTKTMHGGLTFDCLLNCIAGVGTGDGVLTVITSNDITKIDSALAQVDEHGNVSRPGRVDRVLYLDSVDAGGRRQIMQRILPDCTGQDAERLLAIGEDDTVAQFTERCVRIALKTRWGQ